MNSLSITRLWSPDRLSVHFDSDSARSTWVSRPTTLAELASVVANAPTRGLTVATPTGWHADWTDNAGGECVVLSGTLSDSPVEWIDWEAGVARVRAGAPIGDLADALIASGWWSRLLLAPDRMTVGTAIGANPSSGSAGVGGRLSDDLLAVEVVDAHGQLKRITRDERAIDFASTVGCLGLTGVIVAAETRITAISTAWVSTDAIRLDCFEDVAQALTRQTDADWTESIEIDPSAVGPGLGRGVLHRGRPARISDLPASRQHAALEIPPRPQQSAHKLIPAFGDRGMALAHRLRHDTRAPQQEGELLGTRDFLAAAITGVPERNPDWVRYEVRLPRAAIDLVPAMLELLQRNHISPRRVLACRSDGEFHDLLNPPLAGLTFGFSVPSWHDRTSRTLDQLDEMVASGEGHVILSSDSRTRPDLAHMMIPTLSELHDYRALAGSSDTFTSNLGRRLAL